ncbi:anoctamin-8 [Dermacentor andersoni]|uniref:anoctamin-8 n=1 Tax=Dermacentor andersoni TaxID=34620 RepID=UPI002155A56B|nr:anoctamin-8-like [Dermacentor andersoni]
MESYRRKRRDAFRLLSAGRLVGRRWRLFQRTPQQEGDLVLTFSANTDASVVSWFQERLHRKVPQLIVQLCRHPQMGQAALYCSPAAEHLLLRGAEELRLRKRLRPEWGGGHREFTCAEQDCFEGSGQLSGQERQRVMLHWLREALRASGPGDHPGPPSGHRTPCLEGQCLVEWCLAEGLLCQLVALHSPKELDWLKKHWVLAFFRQQPLERVRNYFGAKVAMYFAWLGHYTWSLAVPAIVGLLVGLSCGSHGEQVQEDACLVGFTLLNMLWATIYLELWKRYSSELSYQWGTLDEQNELLVEPRPQFRGEPSRSPVTGRLEPNYPGWKRHLFRYLVTLPVVACCLLIVVLAVFLIFQLQHWWDEWRVQRHFLGNFSFLPKILLAVVIHVLDTVYYRIALWLNDMENYRLDQDYEDQLIIKIAVFQFVNSFLSLFYIAFYLQDMEQLREQLATLLITRQVLGNIKESVIPFLVERLHLACLELSSTEESPSSATPEESPATSSASTPKLSQGEIECAMFKYEGTFEDYLEMFIQFGHVTLFSSAFPWAALCALLNNLVEVRSDAFKLCFVFQRPFAQQANSIGTWQVAMEVMGMLAVVVNCALMGTLGQVQRLWPSLTPLEVLLGLVVLEHVVLCIKFAIAYAIPDVPEWVATEMAKTEFRRRKAAKDAKLTTATRGTCTSEDLLSPEHRCLWDPLSTSELDPASQPGSLPSWVGRLLRMPVTKPRQRRRTMPTSQQ